MTDALVEAVWRHMAIALPRDLNTYPGYQIARAALAAIEQSGTHTIIPWNVAQTICDVMGERSGENAEALKAELDAMLAARPKQED